MDDNEIGAYEPNSAEYDDDSVWGYEVDEPKGTTYAVLSGADSELEYVPQLDEPIHVKFDAAQWNDLIRLVEDTCKDLSVHKRIGNEDAYNLMAGTCNLINTLAQRQAKGMPVDTIVFMDKAARLAAYLFNVCWDLVQQKVDANESSFPVKKPLIRFINQGQEDVSKLHDPIALEALGQTYRKEDFTGRVMIIDEYVVSGGSMKKAWKALTSAGYNPYHLIAMAQFDQLPEWYSFNDLKGIRDPGYVPEEARIVINELPEQLMADLKKAISVIGPKIIEAIQLRLPSELPYILETHLTTGQKDTLRDAGIDASRVLRELTEKCNSRRQGYVAPYHVINYLASAGGFISLHPTTDQLKGSTEYRQVLKMIAEEAFKRGLVEIPARTQALQQAA